MDLLVFGFFFSVVNPSVSEYRFSCNFLLVGGGPREISNREKHIYSEVNDSITLLCPIFSPLPAWFTFLIPNGSLSDPSISTGHDYLRIKHIASVHSGIYTCRVTAYDDSKGYPLTSSVYLDVYGTIFKIYLTIFIIKYDLLGPPEYVEPYNDEYVFVLIERNIEYFINCSINGNPTPSYQWFLGDARGLKKEELLSDKVTYTIISNENDRFESNRTVTCIAENNRGTKRQVFTLQLIN